jgi:ferredoxin
VEGALRVIDGKATLVKDSYCDGLGSCLGACPRGAITIEQREADPFDTEQSGHAHRACPGSEIRLSPASNRDAHPVQWPIQMRLVPVNAPFWENADLLLCADCVPPAFAGFHDALLRGRSLIIACPKLDDTSGYKDKLAKILESNTIRSLTVVRMEVPCCGGLERIAGAALEQSGRDIPLRVITIGVDGRLK